MKLFLFLYLKLILCKLGLKNEFLDISKSCLRMIIWTFFRLQMIFLDTNNGICLMPSAPQVFSISIRTVGWVVRLGGMGETGLQNTNED